MNTPGTTSTGAEPTGVSNGTSSSGASNNGNMNSNFMGGRGNGAGRGRGGWGRGRGSGRGSQGRGRGYGGRGQPNTNTFKGRTEGMNGHTYQTATESGKATQFTKTTEMLGQYIEKEMKFSSDLKCLYEELEQPVLDVKDAIANIGEDETGDEELDKILKSEVIKRFLMRKQALKDNLNNVWSVISGQCSEAMTAKISASTDYEVNKQVPNCAWLLKKIQQVTLKFDDTIFRPLSLIDAKEALILAKQGERETNVSFYLRFKTLAEAVEHYGGSIGADEGLVTELLAQRDAGHPGNPPIIPASTASDYAEKLGEHITYMEQLAIHKDSIKRRLRNLHLGVLFIKNSDNGRFRILKTELRNQFSRGVNHYPVNLSDAYSMVSTYVGPANQGRNNQFSGQVFAQQGGAQTTGGRNQGAGNRVMVAGRNGDTINMRCYLCGHFGHLARQCPEVAGAETQQQSGGAVQLLQNSTAQAQDETSTTSGLTSAGGQTGTLTTTTQVTGGNSTTNGVGTQLLQSSAGTTSTEARPVTTNRGTRYRGLFFLQKRERFKHIPDSWILLDSQSTASVFKTAELLTDIKSNGDTLLMVSNGGGEQLITETGHIRGYGRVWFNKNSLANILSLADVRRRGWRITMDTAEEAAMTVHRSNGTLMKFKEYSSGLYFFDTNDINNGVENYCLVQTVAENERKYHRREIGRAHVCTPVTISSRMPSSA